MSDDDKGDAAESQTNSTVHKILRNIRLIGLFLFFGNTFLQFALSFFIAFDLFTLLGVSSLETSLFYILCLVMLTGFLLIFLGSLIQRKFKKPEVDASKLGEQADFYEHQQQFAEPKETREKGVSRFFLILLILIIITAIITTAYNWTMEGTLYSVWRGFYAYTFAFGAVGIAFLVAMVVGNVNEDMWRLYIRGYHVHESVFGIYFAMIGAPLLATYAFYTLQFAIGMVFIVAGIFLIGRDWKDVVAGRILVHYSKEDDYEEYKKLKENREKLEI